MGFVFSSGLSAYAPEALFHLSRAGGFHHARLPAAIMAAGRTFLRQEEWITEKSMDGLLRAGKRELHHQYLPDGDMKKPGHFWSGSKHQINPLKNLR